MDIGISTKPGQLTASKLSGMLFDMFDASGMIDASVPVAFPFHVTWTLAGFDGIPWVQGRRLLLQALAHHLINPRVNRLMQPSAFWIDADPAATERSVLGALGPQFRESLSAAVHDFKSPHETLMVVQIGLRGIIGIATKNFLLQSGQSFCAVALLPVGPYLGVFVTQIIQAVDQGLQEKTCPAANNDLLARSQPLRKALQGLSFELSGAKVFMHRAIGDQSVRNPLHFLSRGGSGAYGHFSVTLP